MYDDHFALRVTIMRLEWERDRQRLRAQRAESVLQDVLTDLDTHTDRIQPETVERVCAHREWVVANRFHVGDSSAFRQPSEHPLTDEAGGN